MNVIENKTAGHVLLQESTGDLIRVWVDADGLHTHRRSLKSNSDGWLQHQIETIPFDKLIPQAEGQQLLPI